MIQVYTGQRTILARNEGIEPPSSVLEAEVLPLDEFRMYGPDQSPLRMVTVSALVGIGPSHSHRESNPVREGENLASYPMDDGSKVSCTGIEPVFPD